MANGRHRIRIQTPKPFRFLWDPPLGALRYRGAYGGRGKGSSWNFARALLTHGRRQPLRVGCFREFQASIRDSVHHLLRDQIRALGLGYFYHVGERTIVGRNGTSFIFKGLRKNVDEVKSTEGIDVAWVEEAQLVTDASWKVLIPTIRRPRSEIWVSWNTGEETDPTHRRFVTNPPPRSIIRKVTYLENPFLPDVLREEAEELRRRDPEEWEHVWMGEPWARSDAQILSGRWEVAEFTPDDTWGDPLFGLDFGFSQDPAAGVKLWRRDSRLYVEHEAGGVRLSTDELAAEVRTLPGVDDYVVRADNARPETINELTLLGLRVVGAPKWSGSIEDGIAHLRSYDRIVIHPRCTRFRNEARLYSYRTDSRTGDILRKVLDKNNHWIDGTRYALAPFIQHRSGPLVGFEGLTTDDEG